MTAPDKQELEAACDQTCRNYNTYKGEHAPHCPDKATDKIAARHKEDVAERMASHV